MTQSWLQEHAHHYGVLALILTLGVTGMLLFQMNLLVEHVVIWGLSGLYVLWGIVHHAIRRDLTGLIVLEYILIGVLAGLVVSRIIDYT